MQVMITTYQHYLKNGLKYYIETSRELGEDDLLDQRNPMLSTLLLTASTRADITTAPIANV